MLTPGRPARSRRTLDALLVVHRDESGQLAIAVLIVSLGVFILAGQTQYNVTWDVETAPTRTSYALIR